MFSEPSKRSAHCVVAVVFVTLASVALLGTFVSTASAGSTVRVSTSTNESEALGTSEAVSMSPDGQYVAFESDASNLVSGDTNRVLDVFVKNALTSETRRVSTTNAGLEANAQSMNPDLSNDARSVVFESRADNLVSGDANNANDIFIRDFVNRRTTRVSTSSTGGEADDMSWGASISDDGRYVVFGSLATNLVPGDTNGVADVFVKDLVNGTTKRVSVTSGGVEGNRESRGGIAIGPDGKAVAFGSSANNLVSGDSNNAQDIFVHEMVSGQTKRVNTSSAGAETGTGVPSVNPSISADGSHVAFASLGSELVPDDTNGTWDVFAKDVNSGQTRRVSTSKSGTQANGPSWLGTSISSDGNRVGFSSRASNLVKADLNGAEDAFVKDLGNGQVKRVSVSTGGGESDGSSGNVSLSRDGHTAAFSSIGTNLVFGDTNNRADAFVRFGIENGAPWCAAVPVLRVGWRSSLDFSVICSDTDGADGDPVSLDVVSGPAPGTGFLRVDPAGGGRVTFTSSGRFQGRVHVVLRGSDGVGGFSPDVPVDIDVVNRAPDCSAPSSSVGVGWRSVVAFGLDCSDQDGDGVRPSVVRGPDHGSVHVTATGEVEYRPNGVFVGTDKVTLRGRDVGGAVSSDVVVPILVTKPRPVCVGQSVSTPVDVDVAVTLECVDPEGVPLSGVWVSPVGAPRNGSVTGVDPVTRALTYTPDSGFVGKDSFRFYAVDVLGQASALATVQISVGSQPICDDAQASTRVSVPVSIDVACEFTADLVNVTASRPANGTVSGLGIRGSRNGLVFPARPALYTPDPGFVGTDRFDVTISDGVNQSTSQVTVKVEDLTPRCQTASVTVGKNQAKVLRFECVSMPAGHTLDLKVSGGPAHGSLSAIDQSTGIVTYTPNTGYAGPDEVTFTATDTTNGETSTDANITINVVNHQPVCQSLGPFITPMNTGVKIPLVCTDTDGDPLDLKISLPPANGKTTFLNPALVQYTPNLSYTGTDAFQYTATDDSNATSPPATAVVDVTTTTRNNNDAAD